MSLPLPTAKIVLTTAEFNPAEFKFSILGAIPVGGTEPAERVQMGNPSFNRDQQGNVLQSGVLYQLVIQHDTYAPEGDLVQVKFTDDGTGVITTVPEELAPIKPGNGVVTTPGWNAVCHVDPTTDQIVEAQNYTRPVGLFQTVVTGVTAWVTAGQNKVGQALEGLAKMGPAALRDFISGQVENYAVGVQINTCKQIGGYFYNPALPNVPATLPLYAGGEFIANITATLALPVYAAQFGLPAETLIGFVWPVPSTLQKNSVIPFELRHPATGKVLVSFSSPGNCDIKTERVEVVVIDAQYEELPLPIEQNPPPRVTHPIEDTVLRGNGALYFDYPLNDIEDTDALDFFGDSFDGSHVIDFPPGVSYDAKANSGHGRVNISPSVPDGTSFTVRHRAVDTAGQPAAYTKLFYVSRTSTTPEPLPYVTEKRIVGPDSETEGGSAAFWHILLIYNTGAEEVYKGGGTASWQTGYPNGNGLSKFDASTGEWSAQLPLDSIEDRDGDIKMLMRFTFPDGKFLQKDIVGVNVKSNINRPPRLNSPRGTQYFTQGQSYTMNMPYSANEFVDDDGDALFYDLEISSDGGLTYTGTLPFWLSEGSTFTEVNPPLQSGQEFYKLRAVCSDGKGGVAYDPFDLITSPPVATPVTIKDRKYVGAEVLYEGGAKETYHAEIIYSDNTKAVWTGGGTVSWIASTPAEIKNYNSSTGYWDTQVPAGALTRDRTAVQVFTFPDGEKIYKQIYLVHVVTIVNRPPRLVKPRGTIYVTQGKAFSETLPATSDAFVDDDGDALTYALEFSNDDGQTYTSVFPSWLSKANNVLSGTPPTLSQQVVYKVRIVCQEDKGGVAYDPFIIISQVPITPVSSCSVLEEIAYYINAKGSGANFDSIGFYYKGTCTKYEFDIENEQGVLENYTSTSNAATVSLTGNLARFNHRIVQALSYRSWRSKNYQVRFKAYSGGSVVATITFAVDMNNAIATPITGYACPTS